MSDLMESFEEGCEEAEARGDTVLVATDPRELYIDIDSDEQRRQFDRMFEYVAREYGCRVADRWMSKSGPGHEHIIVVLDRDFTVAERIALQAILGSDPLRDLLTLKRLHDGVEQPIRLFKPRVSIAQQPALALAAFTAKDDDDDLPF
jgi:hypothetical protein